MDCPIPALCYSFTLKLALCVVDDKSRKLEKMRSHWHNTLLKALLTGSLLTLICFFIELFGGVELSSSRYAIRYLFFTLLNILYIQGNPALLYYKYIRRDPRTFFKVFESLDTGRIWVLARNKSLVQVPDDCIQKESAFAVAQVQRTLVEQTLRTIFAPYGRMVFIAGVCFWTVTCCFVFIAIETKYFP